MDDDIMADYRAADDPHQWLFAQLVDYFGDTESVAELFDNLEARLERFHASATDPDEPLGFDVFVDHADGQGSRLLLRELPHPVELLWVLCENAQPGDTVSIDHHYADHVVSTSTTWPFSVHDAELLTSPDLAQDERASTNDTNLDATRPHPPSRSVKVTDLAHTPIAAALAGAITAAVITLSAVVVEHLLERRAR
jgi:hypothetical protein